ncbi:10104_t:CDS:2, partial [Dentiscutata heterogama]
ENFPQLYEVLLYKKKDITAIQKKLGINNNINQTAVSESKKVKELADSYELLLELVRNLIPIQIKLGIDINPILEAELRRNKASSDKLIRLFDLLLCLEDDIMTIQEELEFHGPLEDVPSVLIQKFINSRVKKFWFTGEGLPLFPNVSLQQLHEIFVKKLASNNQCPCLESKLEAKRKYKDRKKLIFNDTASESSSGSESSSHEVTASGNDDKDFT